MQPRFVIVPAVPIERESFRVAGRYYAAIVSGGYDIYDNQAKERLKPSYSSKEDAQVQCRQMNLKA
ncbi:hypothetical protein OSW16_14210 [Pseudomonas putida]|uniref:hypothetical protein n=1 Tax=Pseudomonas putida TaxID=303 RepID=UPI002271D324|nr:hypothetical protein [Pseudomonas putida]WAB95729.1 hypothetical protein OSW16_14210 [Pseudomonas putida]